jgi:DNA replication and repair protein RecF
LHIVHLSLANFRNYIRLELDLPPNVMILLGGNAQGKSNLLEAIYLSATTKSPRTASDVELINWSALKEKHPVARLEVQAQRAAGDLRVEIALRGKIAAAEAGASYVQKRIRVNGVDRRAIDLIGLINVVLFSPKDIDLVDGEPAVRRRYLDITNSQVDHRYLRELQRYQRVLQQRNHLLRLIAEHRARPEELDFWDRELVEAGSYLIALRQHTVAALDELARLIHDQLTEGKERLNMLYRSSVDKEAFQEALSASRDKEVAQGMTLIGPHRDDLRFLVNERDMNIYGSRGQNRTIALSLKLAEAKFIAARAGESPVLLLDDMLSELDAQRRYHLLQAALGYRQVVITASDVDRFEPAFLARAARFEVRSGMVEAL